MINTKDFSIYLRAFEPEDYILINKWRNDPELQKLTAGPIRYVSSEMEKAWVQQKMMNNKTELYWAVCANDGSHKMIGYTSINNIDYVNRSFLSGGFLIGDNHYRDGQAVVEAHYIKLDYAFNELNMHRATGDFISEHITSRSILESFYWTFEGIDREALFKCGRYHDLVRASLLRREFLEHQENGDYEISAILRRLVKAIKRNRTGLPLIG